MNKSTPLFQLALPRDIIHYICSFNFYSLEECIQTVKNNKKYFLQKIKELKLNYIIYTYPQSNVTVIYNNKNQFQLNMCNTCHNYIIIQTKISNHGICLCYHEDRHIQQLEDGTYETYYS